MAALPMSNWTLEKALEMRARINNGEQVSREELREAVQFLRQDRSAAAAQKAGAKARGTTKKLSNKELAELF